MTATLTAPRLAALSRPNPQILHLTLFVALAALPLMAAYALDDRLFQGESVWLKPLKFHLALTVYTGTLTLFAMLLPEGAFTSRQGRPSLIVSHSHANAPGSISGWRTTLWFLPISSSRLKPLRSTKVSLA